MKDLAKSLRQMIIASSAGQCTESIHISITDDDKDARFGYIIVNTIFGPIPINVRGIMRVTFMPGDTNPVPFARIIHLDSTSTNTNMTIDQIDDLIRKVIS